jgi:hypothetical protein
MQTSEYLDLALKATGARNDNQLRDHLKWGKSQMHNYRHDKQPMDNKQALELAEMLDIPVMKIIADMEAIRAEKKDNEMLKCKWENISRMAGFVSPNLLFLLALSPFVVRVFYILC